MNLLFFDLETTGVKVSKDKIVQISCLKTNNIFEEIEPPKNILINPGIPIPKEATEVHKITDDMVKDKPSFTKYSKGLFEYFSDDFIICGYNSNSFDVLLLSEEFNRCGIEWPSKNTRFVDSYHIFREKEKRDLTAALRFYTGREMEGAHDALNDVLATRDILKGQMEMYWMDINECIETCKSDKVDLAGTIVMKDGVACYNIGEETKGTPVKSNPGFGMWMLGKGFTTNTKNVVRSILNL